MNNAIKVAAAALLAVGLGALIVAGQDASSGDIQAAATADDVAVPVAVAPPSVKAQSAKPVATLSPVQKKLVMAMSDGDGGIIPVQYDSNWQNPQKLDAFPCAWRAKGAPVQDCMRKDPRDQTGKTIVDFGEMNTMGPGEFTGPNCIPRPCVLFAGEADP